MKKYLFALMLVSSTTIVMSQDIIYGVRAAVNVSHLDYVPNANFENQHRNGFAFAGFVDFNISEKVKLRTELQWSAEGGKNQESRTDYIHLPILLRFSFTDKFSMGFGPKVGLKTWRYKDGFSTAVFSGVAGFEYMITDELFVDATFSYGFTNVLDQDLSRLEAKNHVMQFGFGMKL